MSRPIHSIGLQTITCLSFAVGLLLCGAASAADPLHVRIDQQIAAAHVGPVAGPATDAEFVRRVYLDLNGTIPSVADARKFVDDKSPNKRAALIDQLLNSPAFVRHMAQVFDVMLMERRPDKNVKADEWQKYLLTSLEQNKPYNQLAAEILGADGVDPKLRAPVKFYLDRDAEVNLLTREVGRMFFGVDLECAQCHNHPLIDDYLQSDYYGVYAFLSRSYQFRPDKKKPAVFAEKAEGDVNFKSVFTGDEGNTRPRLPGDTEIDEPTFKKGEEYKVKPDPKKKTILPIPHYSRRAQLAKLATDGSNRPFNRNIVNRLWAHMMGRGLVHPVDLHHSDNPPSHPELLELLADEFVTMKFDIKAFLRELALSQTYQRSFQIPEKLDQHIALSKQQYPVAEAELKKLQAAIAQSKQAIAQSQSAVGAARKTMAPLADELAKANVAVEAAQKTADAATKAQTDVQTQLATKQDVAKSINEAVAKIQEALKILPAEKELIQAAEKFKARAQQYATEVSALTKTATERATASKAAADKLTAAKKVAEAPTEKLNASKSQVAAAKKQLADARLKLIADQATVKHAELRINRFKTIIAYGEKLESINVARAAVAKANTDFPAVKQAADKAVADLATANADLPAVQKAHADAAKSLTDANKQFAEKQEAGKLVGESLAKAKLAAQQMPENAEFAKAVETLKAQSDKLTKEMADIQKMAEQLKVNEKGAADRLAAAQKVVTEATVAMTASQQKLQSIQTQLKQLNDKVATQQAALDLVFDELTEQWTTQFAVAPIEPMTPEQMAWSVLQATGLADRQRRASAAEINKKTPLKPEEQKDSAKLAAREKEIELATYNKLKGNSAKFINLFGGGAGQPQHVFFATIDQALFFANGGEVRGWLAPSGGNLTDRLIKMDDPKTMAEELYLSVMTRRPTAEEVADVAQYLAARPKEKNAAVQEIVWALLTSTEFRFNH